MKKFLSTFIAGLVFVLSFALFSCNEKEPLVVEESEHCIVISVTEDSIGESETLLDYMQALKQKGELDFTCSDGMITSIGGIENPADYSYCWMLYTSDTELSNSAWGTVEYKGNVYGSAVVGASMLEVKVGCLYIWAYVCFA